MGIVHICLLASSRFPIREPFAGGLEAHTHATACALTERGHDVTLFAAEGSDPALNVRTLVPERLIGTKAGRQDLSASPEEWMRDHHAYLGLMLQLAEDDSFDVIHNNSLHHLPVALAPLAKAPVITTLHTPPTPWLESACAYAGSNCQFTAVSSATAAAWSGTVKAQVITNGIDLDRWPAGPGGEPAVWTGRLVPEKAPHLAIDAARTAGLPIVLAGPALDVEYFGSQIAPRLGEDAEYRGHLGHHQLAALVGSATVAVVSSLWDEPYGLVAAEAMACGTPVAATPRGGLVELVAPDAGVLAAEESAEGLAEAMLRAAQLDRESVRAYADAELTLDRMVCDYERLYAEAASSVESAGG